MEQLYIPDKLKVGYCNRSDTYTEKLAYVIYYDGKGVLRKEGSWQSWRDKSIEPSDFENIPTEGFVLNRKAGGGSSGWNHRQTYCRIYDPRGFEFEITIENLLFILQQTDCTRGKGLLGKFVYAWQGNQILLIPAEGEDYQKSKVYTALQAQDIDANSLVPGYTYITKQQKNLVYLGKFDWFEFKGYYDRKTKKEKRFIFVDNHGTIKPLKKIDTLAKVVSDTIVSNFAELMGRFNETCNSSKPTELIEKPLSLDEFLDTIDDRWYHNTIIIKDSDGILYNSELRAERDYSKSHRPLKAISIGPHKKVYIEKGKLVQEYKQVNMIPYSLEEANKLNFISLFVKLENGSEIEFYNF